MYMVLLPVVFCWAKQELHRQIKKELTPPIREVTFWTDSNIVSQYINNTYTGFQTFVSSRLAMIHDVLNPSQWRHVSSDLNPANNLALLGKARVSPLKTVALPRLESSLIRKDLFFLFCKNVCVGG